MGLYSGQCGEERGGSDISQPFNYIDNWTEDNLKMRLINEEKQSQGIHREMYIQSSDALSQELLDKAMTFVFLELLCQLTESSALYFQLSHFDQYFPSFVNDPQSHRVQNWEWNIKRELTYRIGWLEVGRK